MSSQILGLDVGDKRVGVATGDLNVGIAFPQITLERANYVAERAIIEMITTMAIKTIVVGLPLDEQGNRTYQCQKIENFCRRLCARTQICIEYVDEHLTSQEASDMGAKKEHMDAAAAALILQSFLDARGNTSK